MTTATPTVRLNRSVRLGHDLTTARTVEDALDMAGLNWGITIRDAKDFTVNMVTDDGVTSIPTSAPGVRFVMRDDNDVTLGAVGSRYTAVDNASVFGLGRHFLESGASFTEGGELDHGRQVFMRMALPGTSVRLLDGKDLISGGILFKGCHDGSGKVSASLEMTRLVCLNGMVATIPGLAYDFKIAHTASAEKRLAEAHTVLNGAARYAKAFAAAAQHMLDTPMTAREFGRFIDGMWPKPEVQDGDSTRATTIWENRRAALMDLFRFAETNDLGRGTRMAAYNAVTEYVDWGSPVRSASDEPEARVRAVRRFERAGQESKDAAFALLTA